MLRAGHCTTVADPSEILTVQILTARRKLKMYVIAKSFASYADRCRVWTRYIIILHVLVSHNCVDKRKKYTTLFELYTP